MVMSVEEKLMPKNLGSLLAALPQLQITRSHFYGGVLIKLTYSVECLSLQPDMLHRRCRFV